MAEALPTGRQTARSAENLVFAAIVVVFILVSSAYNVVTPAGEGVDEISHLAYTLYLKNNHALPVLPFEDRPGTVLMGYHPPLYYIVAALVIAPLDTSDLARALLTNPHFYWIEGYGPGNRNVFLHSPTTGEDSFPYHGVVLAIHLLRLLSTLQGVAALFVIRAMLRRLLAERTALILTATAATGFQPTFINTFSVAQNDCMVALLVMAGVLWCIRYVEDPCQDKRFSCPLVGGIILGTALLVKETTLALGPVYAVAIGLVALRTRRWGQSARAAGVVALAMLLIAGWWYARNILLYGDPLAQTVYSALYASSLHAGPYRWGDFLAFVQQLRRNYWGAFGYVHILMDQRVGDAFWLAVAVAIPGFLVALIKRRRDPSFCVSWVLAAVAVASFFSLFVRWSMITGGGAAHGRYFVAIMPVVAAATVIGLRQLTSKRWPIGPVAYAGGMVAFGIAAPFAVIAPAYRPPIATAAEIRTARTIGATFGGELELVSADVTPDRVSPSGTATVTLYWRTARSTDSDLKFRVRAVARDGTVIFDKEYWPAGGGVPTYTWPVGVTYRDSFPLPVPGNTAPGRARILVSVQQAAVGWLSSTGGREVTLGDLAIATVPKVPRVPADATPVFASFGKEIDLIGYRIAGSAQAGGSLDVRLYWKAATTPTEDATVSVQILNARGKLVAQNDSEPARGQAPTSTWPENVVVVDDHEVPLPPDLAPGVYQVIVALYTRPSLARLRVTHGGVASDHLDLAGLTVPEVRATGLIVAAKNRSCHRALLHPSGREEDDLLLAGDACAFHRFVGM